MAPAVGAKGNASLASAPPEGPFAGAPEEVKKRLAAAAAFQKALLAGSESVGDRFAAEARAIHVGDADPRPIHGEATRAEAESLLDEGVPIALCPFRWSSPARRIDRADLWFESS